MGQQLRPPAASAQGPSSATSTQIDGRPQPSVTTVLGGQHPLLASLDKGPMWYTNMQAKLLCTCNKNNVNSG